MWVSVCVEGMMDEYDESVHKVPISLSPLIHKPLN